MPKIHFLKKRCPTWEWNLKNNEKRLHGGDVHAYRFIVTSILYIYHRCLLLSTMEGVQSNPEMLGIIGTRLKTTGGHGKTRLISLNIPKDRVETILCSWRYLSAFFTYPQGHYIYPFCISMCKGLFYVFNFLVTLRLEDTILSKTIHFLWQLGKIIVGYYIKGHLINMC